MRNYFLKSERMKYLVLLNLLLLFIGKVIFLFGLIVSLFLLYSYRKVKLSNFNNKDIELNSIFSPITGKIQSIKSEGDFSEITIKTNVFSPLGIYMPFSGTVDQTQIKEIKLYNKLGQSLTLNYDLGLLRDSRTWLKTGDLGAYSANIGFLGIGGSISIKTDKKIKILIEEGQRVFAGQSIIAGFEVNNER